MPRQRKSTATAESTNNTVTDITDRRMKMPLTPDQIKSIYAKRRTKGLYNSLLDAFMESGDPGISVKEEWATQLGEKKATTLKQGFENAKDRKDAPEGSELVDVIVDGEDVFLINRAHTEGLETELVGAEA